MKENSMQEEENKADSNPPTSKGTKTRKAQQSKTADPAKETPENEAKAKAETKAKN